MFQDFQQHFVIISNLINCIRIALSASEMKPITNSKHCTEVDSSEIYISWNDMKWDTFGNVRSYNESVRNMCKPSDGTTNIFLTGTD